jgi:WD40 repeat protein
LSLFSSDDKILGSGAHDKLILLWDITKWEIKHKHELHCGIIIDLKFSLNSKILISSSEDKLISIFDVDSAK